MLSMFGDMFKTKPIDGNQENVSVRSPDQIEQLENLIRTGPVTYVFVHADWCGHCQTYKPIWNELLGAPGRNAQMGMIHHDMVEKSPLLKQAKIPGYPTVLKVFPNGHIEKYKDSNNSMTNAVPNMRDVEIMKKEILEIPMVNLADLSQAKAANSSAEPFLKSMVLSNITKMNKQNVVNTLLRKNNKKSLKANMLKSLDNLLENNKQSNSNNLYSLVGKAASQKTKRNIANRTPSLKVSNASVAPKMNEISIGATKIVPPMKGGSLFTALTQAIQQAGPTAALLLASQALPLPPKKSRGSTMRRTRKNTF
jgi:thiol-disulfide isomerase/thioredoxin